MRSDAPPPVPIDTSVGPQPFLDISHTRLKDGSYEYTITVRGPWLTPAGNAEIEEKLDRVKDIADLAAPNLYVNTLYVIKSSRLKDRLSIAMLVAQQVADDPNFGVGRDSNPYFWTGNRWVDAGPWLRSLDYSMHALIRTATGEGSGDSLTSEAITAWKARSRYSSTGLWLRAFGDAPGIPLMDKVLVIKHGRLSFARHDPTNENLTRLPTTSLSLMHALRTLRDAGQAEGLLEGLPDARPFETPRRSNGALLLQFLTSTLSDEGHLVTMRRWLGYHLQTNTLPNAERMMYLWGAGANGKSQLLWLIRGLLGEKTYADLRLSDLRAPATLELLVGKLAMLGAEASTRTDIETLKALVSREPLNCNPKYRMPFTVMPECLVTQASNFPPDFAEQSDALGRRVISLHLKNSFRGAARVEDIAKRIAADEYPFLLAWAVIGAIENSIDGKFACPVAVGESSEKALTAGVQIEEFGEMLEFGHVEIALSELYEVYLRWCKGDGNRKPMTRSALLKELERYATKQRRAVQVRDKAKLYRPAQWLLDTGLPALIDPKLAKQSRYSVVLGVRISEDCPYGGPIGQAIPAERKDVEMFA